MEMTRREFIQSILKTASAIAISAYFIGEKVSPRKFIRAIRQKKYPGSIKPLSGINTQGKWSG
jgi:hypothetical protein